MPVAVAVFATPATAAPPSAGLPPLDVDTFDIQYWLEGWLLLAIIMLGASSNLFSLLIIRNRELNLIKNFSRLLQMQASYDICYLMTNVPIFVLPAFLDHSYFESELVLRLQNAVMATLHIFLTGSCYTTIALAVERLNAMKVPNTQSRRQQQEQYPMKHVAGAIAVFSMAFNLTAFFDMTVGDVDVTTVHRMNDTGVPHLDHAIVTRLVPHLVESSWFGPMYFVYYKQVATFLLIVLVPAVSLTVLNALIIRRLHVFKSVSVRLGKEERRTVRATVSLIAIAFFFLLCHSVKVVVNGYQVVQTLLDSDEQYTWPLWVERLTVVSHVLLAFNSSMNLLLYCVCDRHFWVIAQKKLKMWFIWPLTLRREFVSLESVTLSHKETVQTTEL